MARQVVNVEIEGSFAHIRLIVLNIERLSPLLLVEDFNAAVEFPEIDSDNQAEITPEDDPKIRATFSLHALIPVQLPPKEQSAPGAGQTQ